MDYVKYICLMMECILGPMHYTNTRVVYYNLDMFGFIMAVVYIDLKLLIRKSLAFKFISNSSILNGSF